ncbi:hypothetical+protein [Methylocapsa aurea]|uniref:hypothetical protein n=1 Tax=Methylocapsa aurea TaxID=663610 RepID=UPI003D18B993
MGEAKRKRMVSIGPTELRPRVDLDSAIDEFECLVETNRIEGFVQIAKLFPPGMHEPGPLSEVKLMTLGLAKQDVYDMLCIAKRAMEETMGFREAIDG